MELELLIGGRRIPIPESFPPPFPPFPAGGNLLPSIPTVPVPPPGDDDAGGMAFPGFPPQKLRPVRGNPSSSEVRSENSLGLLQQQRAPMATDAMELEGTFDKLGVLMNEVCGEGGEYFPLPPDEADCATVLRSIANGGGEAQCSPGLGSPGEGSGSGRQNVEGNNSEGGVLEDESSSSSSDDEEGSSADTKKGLNRKRKRRTREKIEHFVERLVMEVMDKQEQMHAQLIEMLERRERERIMREEDWRKQEMERNKREAAAREEETSRNLALISFIHKALGCSDGDIKISEQLAAISPDQAKDVIFATPCEDKGRWSEAEINALITLRTPIEPKFRIVGPKCSYLWDGISAGMKKMGFNRSGKKCSEKWENMNHYYKKSMENRGKKGFNSNKVPYFHELKLLHEKEGFNSYITANQTTRDASADDVIENQLGS